MCKPITEKLVTGVVRSFSISYNIHRSPLEARRMIAACGNDCAFCPRYNKEPYLKTENELAHTAELWCKIGYRDHIVTNEEISCTGCKEDKWCRYNVVKCTSDKNIENCGQCSQYPCDNIKECFEVTKSFEPYCKQVCTEGEYALMSKAFFEKEKNLNKIKVDL